MIGDTVKNRKYWIVGTIILVAAATAYVLMQEKLFFPEVAVNSTNAPVPGDQELAVEQKPASSNPAAKDAAPEAASEFVKWQYEAGYIRPEAYEGMSPEELESRSRAGDKFASQKLGELAFMEYGDRDAAIDWMKKAAEQGSVAAMTQASLMYDPNSDIVDAHKVRFGDALKGDRVESYIWARLAAMRGDPDALFGVAKNAKHFDAKQITQLEFLAAEQYRQLQDEYKKWYGHGFINNYPEGENLPHEQVLESGRY